MKPKLTLMIIICFSIQLVLGCYSKSSAQNNAIDSSQLILRVNAKYNESVSWGEIYECKIDNVIKGGLNDSLILLYLISNKYDSILYGQMPITGKKQKKNIDLQLIIYFKQIENTKPYINLKDAFIDNKGRKWQLLHIENEAINNIDQKVLMINLNPIYQIVELKNEEFLDKNFIKQPGEGFGLMCGYFRSDTLPKIREYYGIKKLNDHATTEYYFDEGELIFVYENESYGPIVFTDSSGTSDYKSPLPDFEAKYYFKNGKLIFITWQGKPQIIPNEMFFDSQSKEGQLLDSSKKYVKLITDKK